MRPQRIELEGFGSFRVATTLELVDADLFVLSGPTGGGKTTIVDAIVFSLYGSVPRYDDRRLVAPVINQGRNEARVRLTFTVGDRRFEATRVVRRRDGGATTKEARLEEVSGGGHRTLAGTADELTAEVETLLGLTFEQFTRSVVLPQGAFDRFLFAKPSDRADLLVQLLDLGVYELVGRRARSLAATADGRAGELTRQLEGELADATEDTRAAATARVSTLEHLAARCADTKPELDAIAEEGRRLRAVADEAAADRDAMADLRAPDGLDGLAADLAAATEAREAAEAELTRAGADVEAAEATLAALPDPATVDELRRLDHELEVLAEQRGDIEEELADASAEAAEATVGEDEATRAVGAARTRLDAARRDELVQTLAADLSEGDPCPVCGTAVEHLPHHAEASATAQAAAALDDAERQLAAAQQLRAVSARRVAAAEATLANHVRRLDEIAGGRRALLDHEDLPDDPDRLADLERRLDAARAAGADARARERAARKRLGEAGARSAALRDRVAGAWAAFDTARDRVARLEPPRTDRDDLAGAWSTLLAWAAACRPQAEAAAVEAQAAVDDAARRYRKGEAELRRRCAEADVDVPAGTTPTGPVTAALTTARHRLEQVEQQLARAAAARRDLAAAREEQVVAAELGRHLRADAFERWLLSRALQLLVTGASGVLRDLSSGAYSLAVDDTSQFQVIDHRNADEPRTVRSLSGGERFLASLALALALADHVAELAAEGAARLESLFLDEGFGTLDADALDVVAGAIEELGSRGRMVGVITHVQDLAERLPVRFEVQRDPAGSTIRRVDGDAAHEEDAA